MEIIYQPLQGSILSIKPNSFKEEKIEYENEFNVLKFEGNRVLYSLGCDEQDHIICIIYGILHHQNYLSDGFHKGRVEGIRTLEERLNIMMEIIQKEDISDGVIFSFDPEKSKFRFKIIEPRYQRHKLFNLNNVKGV